MASSRQNSRFSTLNVFKFAGSKAESQIPPPPLPPKDPYYAYNRSVTSLAQDSLSLPTSPTSTVYGQRLAPGPSQSTLSLMSSVPSTVETVSSSAPPKKSFFKFSSLGKRGAKSSRSEASISPPAEDDSISMPWNFQHNIHVDEAYTGIPPSWSARLLEVGFSEEEIAAMHARRNVTRSPTYSDQAYSPISTSPILLPHPRNSSLPRQPSNASLASSYRQRSQRIPPVPIVPPLPSSLRNASDTSSLSSSHAESQYIYINPNGQPILPLSPTQQSERSSSPSQRSALSQSATTHPRTPPRRPLHVVNESPGALSPPPAYRSPTHSGFPREKGGPPPDPDSEPEGDAEGDTTIMGLRGTEDDSPVRNSRRLTALPPRLSLHDDNDLSSWSEALLSAIPSVASDSSSPSSASGSSRSSNRDPQTKSPASGSSKSERRQAPPKPIPSINIAIGDNGQPTTPLWEEVLGMVQELSPVSSSALSPPPLSTPFSPALSTSSSPRRDSFEHEGDDLLTPEERERESNRDSGMSTVSSVSTATVTGATIVRDASIATRAMANMIPSPNRRGPSTRILESTSQAGPSSAPTFAQAYSPVPGSSSPKSSRFSDSSSSGGSGSGSSSSRSREHQSQSPTSEVEVELPLKSPRSYLEPSPSPAQSTFTRKSTDTFGGKMLNVLRSEPPAPVISEHTRTNSDAPSPASSSPMTTPRRYRGWQAEIVADLEEYIDYSVDPREHFVDLVEIAEGESGSVFAAKVVAPDALKIHADASVVAIKSVAILPNGSPKLAELQEELALMKGLKHIDILTMDALYVDLVDDSLWIRMELMQRSLADVVELVNEGLILHERMIARFASDVLSALIYLQEHRIAHRDVRSDNLLLNGAGVLKIADFSNAVQVTPDKPLCSDAVGVIYWQAPEMRSGSYDALKVDTWSLGATIWEMAQTEPPFANVEDTRQIGNRWPPLSHPELFSRSFHDFLRLCSQPPSSRPSPTGLSKIPFVQNACGRVVIVQLLTQCKTIEEKLASGDSAQS